MALPADVVGYLGRLRAIGMSERTVAIERDAWILLSAHSGHSASEVSQWILE